MVKWWANSEPFAPEEVQLLQALYQAHAQCVFRPNCSTVACQQAGGGSRSITNAYIGALACLGEMHGPIEDAYTFLAREGPWTGAFVIGKIPGWGNSFIKGRIDDAFLPVDQILEASFSKLHSRLREITDALHARGKMVFPNPAAYTATVALIIGLPRHLAPMLFVQARLEPWGMVFHQTIMQLTKPHKEEEAA